MNDMEIQNLRDLFEDWRHILCGLPEIRKADSRKLEHYMAFNIETAHTINDEPAFVTLVINTNKSYTQVCKDVEKFATRCFIRFNKHLPVL